MYGSNLPVPQEPQGEIRERPEARLPNDEMEEWAVSPSKQGDSILSFRRTTRSIGRRKEKRATSQPEATSQNNDTSSPSKLQDGVGESKKSPEKSENRQAKAPALYGRNMSVPQEPQAQAGNNKRKDTRPKRYTEATEVIHHKNFILSTENTQSSPPGMNERLDVPNCSTQEQQAQEDESLKTQAKSLKAFGKTQYPQSSPPGMNERLDVPNCSTQEQQAQEDESLKTQAKSLKAFGKTQYPQSTPPRMKETDAVPSCSTSEMDRTKKAHPVGYRNSPHDTQVNEGFTDPRWYQGFYSPGGGRRKGSPDVNRNSPNTQSTPPRLNEIPVVPSGSTSQPYSSANMGSSKETSPNVFRTLPNNTQSTPPWMMNEEFEDPSGATMASYSPGGVRRGKASPGDNRNTQLTPRWFNIIPVVPSGSTTQSYSPANMCSSKETSPNVFRALPNNTQSTPPWMNEEFEDPSGATMVSHSPGGGNKRQKSPSVNRNSPNIQSTPHRKYNMPFVPSGLTAQSYNSDNMGRSKKTRRNVFGTPPNNTQITPPRMNDGLVVPSCTTVVSDSPGGVSKRIASPGDNRNSLDNTQLTPRWMKEIPVVPSGSIPQSYSPISISSSEETSPDIFTTPPNITQSSAYMSSSVETSPDIFSTPPNITLSSPSRTKDGFVVPSSTTLLSFSPGGISRRNSAKPGAYRYSPYNTHPTPPRINEISLNPRTQASDVSRRNQVSPRASTSFTSDTQPTPPRVNDGLMVPSFSPLSLYSPNGESRVNKASPRDYGIPSNNMPSTSPRMNDRLTIPSSSTYDPYSQAGTNESPKRSPKRNYADNFSEEAPTTEAGTGKKRKSDPLGSSSSNEQTMKEKVTEKARANLLCRFSGSPNSTRLQHPEYHVITTKEVRSSFGIPIEKVDPCSCADRPALTCSEILAITASSNSDTTTITVLPCTSSTCELPETLLHLDPTSELGLRPIEISSLLKEMQKIEKARITPFPSTTCHPPETYMQKPRPSTSTPRMRALFDDDMLPYVSPSKNSSEDERIIVLSSGDSSPSDFRTPPRPITPVWHAERTIRVPDASTISSLPLEGTPTISDVQPEKVSKSSGRETFNDDSTNCSNKNKNPVEDQLLDLSTAKSKDIDQTIPNLESLVLETPPRSTAERIDTPSKESSITFRPYLSTFTTAGNSSGLPQEVPLYQNFTPQRLITCATLEWTPNLEVQYTLSKITSEPLESERYRPHAPISVTGFDEENAHTPKDKPSVLNPVPVRSSLKPKEDSIELSLKAHQPKTPTKPVESLRKTSPKNRQNEPKPEAHQPKTPITPVKNLKHTFPINPKNKQKPAKNSQKLSPRKRLDELQPSTCKELQTTQANNRMSLYHTSHWKRVLMAKRHSLIMEIAKLPRPLQINMRSELSGQSTSRELVPYIQPSSLAYGPSTSQNCPSDQSTPTAKKGKREREKSTSNNFRTIKEALRNSSSIIDTIATGFTNASQKVRAENRMLLLKRLGNLKVRKKKDDTKDD